MRKYDATNKRPIMLRQTLRFALLFAITTPASYPASSAINSYLANPAPATAAKVLTALEATPYLPNTVFFRGQRAPIHARNSGGVQFTKDTLLLVTLVDTAGYSSSLQEKYQAYLITELPVIIEGHLLQPGAYGCGFVANNTFVVMDIGGHDLFSVPSTKDAALRRPTPLQVLPAPNGAGYRLYEGRDFVGFTNAAHETSSTTSVHP
jgi:hypothetical protein